MKVAKEGEIIAEDREEDEFFTFGDFRLFPSRRLLLEGNRPVPLGGRAFDLLEALLRQAGRTVTKEELVAAAWPNIFVQEGSLRVQIAGLRKSLKDGEGGRRYIINDAGRGYSFASPVTQGGRPAQTSAPRSQCVALGNLPVILTRVVGRQKSIEALETELPHRRLITVVGPGGIGKTTLAVSAAAGMRANCPEGVWFVDLAPIGDPALVPSAVASVFGLAVASTDPSPELIDFVRNKQLVVVIDNCEHVIDSVAALGSAVLREAPHVRILATSREPLRITGEFLHHLGPLEVPPEGPNLTAEAAMSFSAVELFVERAKAALDEFALRDEDASTVGEICRRLDGIALAIELATARVDALGIHGVAAQLDDRFHLLSKGSRTATPRHRTLNAVFDWSHRLLPEASQRVFECLSIFTGSFSMAAAQAIAANEVTSPNEVMDHLSQLVSVSLVVANVTSGPPSYRLLDSARAYGRERLTERNELFQISRRHAEYFLQYFERANIDCEHWAASEWIHTYKSQLDNLRGAMDWANQAQSLELRDALTIAAGPLFSHLSLSAEYRERVDLALAARPAESLPDDHTKKRLLDARGMSLLYKRSGFDEATATLRDALSVAKQVGDVDYQMKILSGLWSAFFMAGDVSEAEKVEKQYSHLAGVNPSLEYAMVRSRMRGVTLFYRGRFEDAKFYQQAALESSLRWSRGSDIPRFQFDQTVMGYTNIAKTLWSLGLADQATASAERAVELARIAEQDFALSYALAYAACRIAIMTGDYVKADLYVEELSQLSAGDPTLHWGPFARCWKGTLLSRQGDAVSGAHHLSEALQQVPEGSFGLHHTRFLGEHAFALALAGDVTSGLARIRKALEICDRQDERWFYVELLHLEGEILMMENAPGCVTRARDRFDSAFELADRQGALAFKLRVAISLARLDLAGGSGTGFGRLRETYAQFTEGFGTLDLIEASSLLDFVR